LRGKGRGLEGGAEAWVTVHPSFLLRVRDDREAEYERFVADLRRIGDRVKEPGQ
jgi:DNA polymerase